MYINISFRCVCITIVSVGKQLVLHNRSVCIALFVQHAKRMPHIVLSSVACPAVQYFSTSSHKWYDFREEITEHKMCVLIFSVNFV